MSFSEKKRKKNIYLKLSIFVLLVLIFFVWRGTIKSYFDAKVTSENNKIAKQQLEDLEKRNLEIVEEISKLKTKEGIEEEIRNKFSVVKKGEKMIMVVDSNDFKNPANEEKTFWEKFKSFFEF